VISKFEGYLAELFSGDDNLAEAAVAKMIALPDAHPEVIGVLEAELESPQVDRRWWAGRALAALPDSHAPSLLIRLLSDDDPSVRQCAALGLRLQPMEAAVAPLVALLEDDDYLCADLAADALVAIGAPAVTPLLEVLAGGAPQARVKAARALAQIGDLRAIPGLFAVLDEDSALLEYWAAEGLDRMGVGMVFFDPD
jgi:HEAT repeat protein